MSISAVLALGVLGGCSNVKEVPCEEMDELLYEAQLEDLGDAHFQAKLDDKPLAEDLVEAGKAVQLGCATFIENHEGKQAISAMEVGAKTLWVDVDDPGYVKHRESFEVFLEEEGWESWTAYVDGVGRQIDVTAHELTHYALNDYDHSDETEAFIKAIPKDNGLGLCEGWTYVADNVDDLVYEAQAKVACAYEAFVPQKIQDLAEEEMAD